MQKIYAVTHWLEEDREKVTSSRTVHLTSRELSESYRTKLRECAEILGVLPMLKTELKESDLISMDVWGGR